MLNPFLYRWGVSSQQQRTQGNFVAHFQCHVCEKVARNLKFSNLGIIHQVFFSILKKLLI